MPEKIRIGSRVSGLMPVPNGIAAKYEVAMKVLGYDGLKNVIVETLEERGHWEKGHVTIVPTKDLTLREEVKYIAGEAEDGHGPAIGWLELGHLSVALTRDTDGTLLVSLERAIMPADEPSTRVRVRKMPGSYDLWEGEI